MSEESDDEDLNKKKKEKCKNCHHCTELKYLMTDEIKKNYDLDFQVP